MITYGLGLITYKSKDAIDQPDLPKASINIPVDLSNQEYVEVKDAIVKVSEFIQYNDLYKMIIWNFEDLLNTILSYLQAYTRKDLKYFETRSMNLNINKDFLNVLTSIRFYLDYMERSIKNEFGDASDILTKFESYCSREYDNNFSYRFVYHLRNYSQHKGFVVDSISMGQIPGKENQLQVNHYLNVCLNRNSLLNDKKLKKEIRPEIEGLPDKIDVKEHIRSCMDSLAKIHGQILQDLMITIVDSAKLLKQYTGRLSYDINDRQIVPTLFQVDHSDQNVKDIRNISHMAIPLEEANQLIAHSQK